MTDEQLRAMSEQEIRARFRAAPGYYLQAKLEKKRALERRAVVTPAHTPPAPAARARRNMDAPLPGFEILDAALSESGDSHISLARGDAAQAGLTQHAILESALEDYATWPLRADSQSPSDQPLTSDLERKLALVLDRAPELKLVLDLEPELEVVLESAPELQQAMALEGQDLPANVTMADFGQRAPRTVPVVSVVMDRKRPNMVRVIGKSTRLAG
jgi:hypothetical protein